MLGAMAGDIIGSVYEWQSIYVTDFPLFQKNSVFTDDTVLTVAVASALMSDRNYARTLRIYARRYPKAGYGSRFKRWAMSEDAGAYNSYGNGSAMRVSPVAWAFNTLEEVLHAAQKSAEVTHNHPEGIKGAQATAAAIFLARTGATKEQIRSLITSRFGYNLNKTVADLRPLPAFDVTCQGSVPNALIAFLESTDFEDCVRNTVALGGDSDTQAAIAGSIAEGFYSGVPQAIQEAVFARLDAHLLQVVHDFRSKFLT